MIIRVKMPLLNCGKHLKPADEPELVAAEPELETENYQAPPAAPLPKRQRPGNQQNVIGRGQLAIPGGSSGSGGRSLKHIAKPTRLRRIWYELACSD